MSVITYEDEKFLRVAKSLKFRSTDLGHFFGYPKEWDKQGGMDKHIEKFAQDLRDANVDASNERYKEKKESSELDFTKDAMTLTIYELIKSLKGIAYNTVESKAYPVTMTMLKDMIYHFMGILVDTIPEYKAADTW